MLRHFELPEGNVLQRVLVIGNVGLRTPTRVRRRNGDATGGVPRYCAEVVGPRIPFHPPRGGRASLRQSVLIRTWDYYGTRSSPLNRLVGLAVLIHYRFVVHRREVTAGAGLARPQGVKTHRLPDHVNPGFRIQNVARIKPLSYLVLPAAAAVFKPLSDKFGNRHAESYPASFLNHRLGLVRETASPRGRPARQASPCGSPSGRACRCSRSGEGCHPRVQEANSHEEKLDAVINDLVKLIEGVPKLGKQRDASDRSEGSFQAADFVNEGAYELADPGVGDSTNQRNKSLKELPECAQEDPEAVNEAKHGRPELINVLWTVKAENFVEHLAGIDDH